MASAAFWMALLSAFLLLKFIAEAGMALDRIRVQKEHGTRPQSSEDESGIARDLRKVA